MSQIKVELQSFMGSDRDICEAAWTSSTTYSKKKDKTDEDVKNLIKMLADNHHSTPFESVVLRFWLKVPISIDRQIMTHRIQSSSGMSGRYRTMPNEFLKIPEDIKVISRKLNLFDTKFPHTVEYEYLCEKANEEYQKIINNLKKNKEADCISNDEYKRCREFFRGMLPQHNMTERVSIMNLRAFANFYKLRSSHHAQLEIQEVAKLMLEEIKKARICPEAIKNLENNSWQI